MNKKGGNPWILCPSKSFPGKLYYFNVITGETAWCLTEEEKRTLSNDATINKISDKNHSYPEPNTLPTDNGTDFSNFCYNFTPQPPVPINYHIGTPQIFSQPVFSRYNPNQYMPGYMMPMPQMLMANKPIPKKRSFDQITQTSDDSLTCIQGYSQPLSKRFGSYYAEVKKDNTEAIENKGINPNTLNTDKVKWWNKSSAKSNDSVMQGSVFGTKLNKYNKPKESTSEGSLFRFNLEEPNKLKKKSVLKDPVLKTTDQRNHIEIRKTIINHNFTKTDNIRKQILNRDPEIKAKHNQQIKEFSAMNIVNNCSKQLKFDHTNATVAKESWVQNPLNEDLLQQPNIKCTLNSYNSAVSSLNETDESENQTDALNRLDSNDLRLVLQAKRRKSGVTNETQTNVKNDLNGTNEIKKQVTFDLLSLRQTQKDEEVSQAEESEVETVKSEIVSEDNIPMPLVINTSYLKNLSKPYLKTDPWYVVVDIGVLLDDFDFIEDFVKKDVTSRLLVPNSVRSYIETMSVGEYAGRCRVMLARKAMRRLAAPSQHLVLQPPLTDKPLVSAIDGTIECCLQVLQCNHTILITTDTELYAKGIAAGIDTYKLDDIKHSLENEPQLTFEMGKVNVTILNDNIFMQNPDEYEPFPLNKKVNLPGNNSSKMLSGGKRHSVETNKTDISNTVINDKMAANNSNIFKVPTIVKKNRQTSLVLNKVNRNSVVSKNLLSDKICLNYNKPNQKLNENEQIDCHIENDIKLLSLRENKTQTKKLSDNFYSFPLSNIKQDFRKIIITTNVQANDDNSDNSLKTEQQKNLFKKDTLDFNKEPDVTSTSELRMKKPLNVSKSVVQYKKTVNDGHRFKINAYNMEELLKRFHIKDVTKNRRINSRFDEWICCYYQIMEDCLTHILMNNSPSTHRLTAPWYLLEAVICVKDLYSTDPTIKTIADKLLSILSTLMDKNDNLRNKIKPADFMKLFGCGLLLVESLKTASPHITQIVESEKLLNNLLHRIQDPAEDQELLVPSKSDTWCKNDDTEGLNKNVVLKKPSEILDYLKQHFPAWKNFDESNLRQKVSKVRKEHVRNKTTVVRSFGKNLNTIRISNANQMTFDDTSVQKAPKFKENIEVNVDREEPKHKRLEKIKNDTANENNTKDNGLFKDVNRNTDEDKISNINNRKSMAYRDWNESMDDDTSSLDCIAQKKYNFANDMIIETDVNPCIDAHVTKNNVVLQNNDKEISLFDNNDDEAEVIKDDTENCNDSTVDSGFVNQSLEACSLIRLFLSELSASFKLIYKFIDTSIQELSCDGIRHENKKIMYDKANEIHLYVADVIGNLRRIIDREASENTKLKSFVINAGVEALADKRLTRYRQVVIKCLEQAQLLEDALKTVLALTNEHCDITAVDIDRQNTHVPFFNIFE